MCLVVRRESDGVQRYVHLGTGNYNPVTAMLTTLSEPVLRPFRRLVPPIGGLDISPIFAIVLLQAGVIILQNYKPLPV